MDLNDNGHFFINPTDSSHILWNWLTKVTIYIYPIDNNHILWTLLRITTFWIVPADNSHIFWILLTMATLIIDLTDKSHVLWTWLIMPPFYKDFFSFSLIQLIVTTFFARWINNWTLLAVARQASGHGVKVVSKALSSPRLSAPGHHMPRALRDQSQDWSRLNTRDWRLSGPGCSAHA